MRQTDPLRRAIPGGFRGVLIELGVVIVLAAVAVLLSAVITALA